MSSSSSSSNQTYLPVKSNHPLQSLEIEQSIPLEQATDEDGNPIGTIASRPEQWNCLVQLVKCLIRVLKSLQRHPILIASIFACAALISSLFLILAGPCVMNQWHYYQTPLSYAASTSSLNIVLMGDSLVMGSKYPIFFIVATRIQSLLPNFNMKLHDLGQGGNGITAIKARLPLLYALPADAVILLWDSDAYVLGYDESDAHLAALKVTYVSNVTYVVQEIQRNKPGRKQQPLLYPLILLLIIIILSHSLICCLHSHSFLFTHVRCKNWSSRSNFGGRWSLEFPIYPTRTSNQSRTLRFVS